LRREEGKERQLGGNGSEVGDTTTPQLRKAGGNEVRTGQ